MISEIIHGGDEFTHLPEAPIATENGGTQAPYGISHHRTIVEEEEEKDRGKDKSFQCYAL